METILIKPELLKQVIDGSKTTTCRNGIRNYPLGETVLKSNVSEDFVYINITKLHYRKLKDIDDKTAKSDGFTNKDNLVSVLRGIYSDIADESDITIVEFKLLGDYKRPAKIATTAL